MKLSAALRIEAVERLDQAQARDLDQVLERFGGGAVAKREASRQGKEAVNELLLELRVAGRCVAAQKRVLINYAVHMPPSIRKNGRRKNGLSSTKTDRPV